MQRDRIKCAKCPRNMEGIVNGEWGGWCRNEENIPIKVSTAGRAPTENAAWCFDDDLYNYNYAR